jgi:protein-export membrane protein SecD
MYCIECGSENPENGLFCYKCGSPIFRKENNAESQIQKPKAEYVIDTALSQGKSAEKTSEFQSTDKSGLNQNAASVESEIPLEPQQTKPLSCPNCGLINPPGAFICDCGYNFDLKTIQTTTLIGRVAQVHPWLRYWARAFDLMLFGLFAGLVLASISPKTTRALDSRSSAQSFTIILLFLWVFVEAFLISKCWMTPGKWFFRITVIPSAGGVISYGKALSRSFKVWWRGLGIGFPIASIITMSFAYSQLTRHSVTTWDRDEGLVVTHEKLGLPRILLIIGCFVAFFLLIVFSETISEGQLWSKRPENGIHLVLRVETDDALNQELFQDADRISQELKFRNIAFAGAKKGNGYSVEIDGVDYTGSNEARSYFESTYDRKYSLTSETLEGKTNFSLTLLGTYIRDVRESTVRQTLETIRRRVDALGIRKPWFQISGVSGEDVQDRIIVELPGVPDPDRVKSLIENTAQLELRLVKKDQSNAFGSIDSAVAASGGEIAEGYEILPYRENRGEQNQLEYLIVSKAPVITGNDLKTARKSSDSNGRPAVGFFLTAGGSKRFALATEQHVGEKMAIILDNVVSSAPVINERIESEGIIHGQFTEQQAEDLALLLRSGALPASLRIIEDREIGNSSGNN